MKKTHVCNIRNRFVYRLLFTSFFIATSLFAYAAPIKIVPMGDSITVGNNNLGTNIPPSWRKPLWDKMIAAGWDVDFVGHTTSRHSVSFDQDHSAKLGGCIQDLQGFISLWTTQPDVALVYIGANHLTGSCAPYKANEAANEVGKVIDNLRTKNPTMIIFLAQIYPITVGGRFPLSDYQNYNTELAAIASAKTTTQSPIIIVDQFTGFNESTDLLQDRVHPNSSGEEKIAQKWFDALNASSYVQNRLSNTQAPSANTTQTNSPLFSGASGQTASNSSTAAASPVATNPLTTNTNTVSSTGCNSCCTTIIKQNMDIHIPVATLEQLPNLAMWADLKFMPTNDGKIWWILDNYGTNCANCSTTTTAPTSTLACNGLVEAGSSNPETHDVQMGKTSGSFMFRYTMHVVKDQMLVLYEGKTLFDTGCVGPGNYIELSQPLTYQGNSSTITVKVIPNCDGANSTQWEFKVDCPN